MSFDHLDSRAEESPFTVKYSTLVEQVQGMNDPLEGKFCHRNEVVA